MNEPEEKRKSKRFLLPVALYEEIGGKHICGVSNVWDVSHGGFRLLAPVNISKGAILRCRISVPKVLDLVCEGMVCWTGATSEKKYWIGLCFTKIKPSDKVDLLNYGYDSWLEAEKKKSA